MIIFIASDHRGVKTKGELVHFLKDLGHTVEDKGPFNEESVDYPLMAQAVAKEVFESTADDCRGILMCGTGIGMSIAANKFPRIRAALCHDEKTTEFSRRHNDSNVFCFGVDILEDVKVKSLIKIWLETGFDGVSESRHMRRLSQIL